MNTSDLLEQLLRAGQGSMPQRGGGGASAQGGLGDLGGALRLAGRAEDAVEPLTRSVELHEGLLAGDPRSVVYQRDLAIGLRDLDELHRDTN